MFPNSPSTSSSASSSKRRVTRTRTGCLTCRREGKVKCDQQQPVCARCIRLGLQCKWDEKPLSLKERRRLEAEKWAATPPEIRMASKTQVSDPSASATEDYLAAQCTGSLELAQRSADATISYVPGHGVGEGLDTDLFDSISASWTDDFSDPFLYLSPASDMVLGTASIFASLPSLLSLTKADQQALDYFQKEVIFGFGSKSPAWSTHAILLQSGSQQPMVLHLLLAASLTELGWQHPSLRGMIDDAEKHYLLGRSLLLETTSSHEEAHHLAMLASFWFLYLYQRRRCRKQSMSYRELSRMVSDHVQKFGLHQILSSSEPPTIRSGAAEVASPQTTSLLARLTTWLFWIDAQSSFQGEGGSLARLLLRSSSSKGILDIYERSRATLELHWGQSYPDSELADDLKNGGALELIHRTWVIVQEINEATELGPLDPDSSHEIKVKMEALRTRYPFSSIFRLAESPATTRDRLMANSDWAVCNYYALCIYHFRSGIETEAVAARQESESIDAVVAALVGLIQKTLSASEKGQADRLQWSLFCAGIETSDPVYCEWILMKLTNPGLQAALEIILLEQSGAGRIGIGRIRRICQEKCGGGSGSGDEWALPV